MNNCPICGKPRSNTERHYCALTFRNVKTAYERAMRTVEDLCMGRKQWVMNVPAEDDDPDITIAEALVMLNRLAEEYLDE